MVPYHWNQCVHCVKTRNEIGTRDMNLTNVAWKAFGEAMQAAQAKALAQRCSALYDPSLRSNRTLFGCLRRGLLKRALPQDHIKK